MRAAAALALSLLLGCSTVSQAGGGSSTSTGDVWYTMVTASPFGVSSGPIFYCPAPTAPGPVTCTEPTIDEPVAAAAAPGASAGTCSSLAIATQSAAVSDTTVDSPLPAAAAGPVADGVYALSSYEWHSAGAHTASRRTLLRIQGPHVEMVYGRNADPPTSLGGTVQFDSDGAMRIAVTCPRTGNLEFDRYAVVPNGLILISTEQNKIAVFTRMP